MGNINIKNGILLTYNKNYSIYQMYTIDAEEYYMCIANIDSNEYQMVVDFKEDYFDSLLENEQITEIKKNCDILFDEAHPYIYILPNLNTFEYSEAKNNNDDRTYQLLLRKIQKYTYDTFKAITEGNNIKINQVINIVVQTEDDKKFVNWLDMKLTNVSTICLSEEYCRLIIGSHYGLLKFFDVEHLRFDSEVENEKEKLYVKKLKNKKGFTNIHFILLILFSSFVLGISIAKILLR